MEVTRVFDLLERLVLTVPEKDDILSRKINGRWQKFSVKDYYRISHRLAAGFLGEGFRSPDKVITICNNRPEWNFIDMALGLAGLVHVPVYTTLSQDDFSYIFKHSDAKMICAGNHVLLERIAPVISQMDTPPRLMIMDPAPENRPEPVAGREIEYLEDFVKKGEAVYPSMEKVIGTHKKNISADDLFTIIYTSGTTGLPKGVMLSHKSIVFNAIGHAVKQIKNSSHRMLSFLPLCHIYERSMNYEYQYLGISIYYAESLATIAADLADCRADGFCAVPRVLEMMYMKLESTGKNLKGIKKDIYGWAFEFGNRFDNYNKNPVYLFKRWLADKLIYSKWRKNLGGKQMLVVSGGSAIGEKIVRLFNAAGLHIFEGYGMTETSPVIAVNNPVSGINVIGTVGVPMEGTRLKIAPDGEILTKGPHIMMGYYKDPEYTRQVIDPDGWLHTGDIGYLQDGKYLKITDRKKEIFKLSAGKYVAPQVIENYLKESMYIENCIVIGENRKFPSALIIPNFNKLHYWCAKHKVDYKSNNELITNEKVIEKINREVNKVNERLAPHEQIRKPRLLCDEWNIQNNMLSQTYKLKRTVIHKAYAGLIQEIYSNGNGLNERY